MTGPVVKRIRRNPHSSVEVDNLLSQRFMSCSGTKRLTNGSRNALAKRNATHAPNSSPILLYRYTQNHPSVEINEKAKIPAGIGGITTPRNRQAIKISGASNGCCKVNVVIGS